MIYFKPSEGRACQTPLGGEMLPQQIGSRNVILVLLTFCMSLLYGSLLALLTAARLARETV